MGKTAQAEGFVEIPLRDNFYQTSAFIPMSFALVTTVHEGGETGIGPHALLYPFHVTQPYSMLLISRTSSATAGNIRRTGKCALNYIEYDRDWLSGVTRLGYPGRPIAEKQADMPFRLVPSPSPDRAGPDTPAIIAEAAQVMECTLDRSYELDPPAAQNSDGASRFVLTVDTILLKPRFSEALDGGPSMPNMPVFYGFRSRGDFWFAEHSAPFAIAAPQVKGQEVQTVWYIANRIDPGVRFTREACSKFTEVPPPFLKTVLSEVIKVARAKDVSLVDLDFVETLNRERS